MKSTTASGIPNNDHPVRRWTPEEVALLGTMSDRRLARKLRRTRPAVVHKRRKLDIPAKIEGDRFWRPEDVALLGQRSDQYIARLLGRTVGAVQRRRRKAKIFRHPPSPRRQWTPEEDALLGTMSDEQVARRLKCSAPTIALRRAKLKIPTYGSKRTPRRGRAGVSSLLTLSGREGLAGPYRQSSRRAVSPLDRLARSHP